MKNTTVVRVVLLVLGMLLAAYVVVIGLDIIVTLLVAIIIASALRPMVVRLTKMRVPHNFAVILVYIFSFALIALLLIAVVPPIINQLALYIDNESRLANQLIRAQNWVVWNANNVLGMGLEPLQPEVIREFTSDVVVQLRRIAPSYLDDLSSALAKVALVFLMGVYWLSARNDAVAFIASLFPLGERERLKTIISEIETTMGSYVRGAVAVALFVGVVNGLLLTLFGVPNSAIYGFIVGVATLLPVIGGFLGGGLAAFLALLNNPLHGLIVLAVFVGVQQVEANYLTPRVMASSVGVNPLLVIVAVLIGYTLGSVIGAILSLPVIGTLAVLARHFIFMPRQAEVQPVVERGGAVLIGGNRPRRDEADGSDEDTDVPGRMPPGRPSIVTER